MQQQFARPGTMNQFRTFSPTSTESMEGAPDSSHDFASGEASGEMFTRYPNTLPRGTPSSSTEFSPASRFDGGAKKGHTNPFPEELNQECYSPANYVGASEESFSKETIAVLQMELAPEDIEVKPDGVLYMPECRYRKVLLKAFGPGGWCLIPRSAHSFQNKVLSREYALYCGGRFVSQVRGHAAVQDFSNPAMASEVVRSNALMRACKDLGIGLELWDPTFVTAWKNANAEMKRDAQGRIRWAKALNRGSNSTYG